MLVQTLIPATFSPQAYDDVLAKGWFRSSSLLYNIQVLCLDGKLSSAVNIRLPLDNFTFSKSQRKILRHGNERFRIKIGPAIYDSEKEELYQLHRKRFKAFVHSYLEDFFVYTHFNKLFDTREICVYDGNRLVAFSIFDVGARGMAAILCAYHEDFAQYSLGHFTMLREVEMAIAVGMDFYYPGYILDKSSVFDYKLRLGEMKYLNDKGVWVPRTEFNFKKTKAREFNQKLTQLSKKLKSKGIEPKKKLYPFYALGYMDTLPEKVLKYPAFLQLTESNPSMIATYDMDQKCFIFMEVSERQQYREMVNMELSDDYARSNAYKMEILAIDRILDYEW
ncbi:MAG: GNAT family N-acetyltransferase [Flavobacteriales bacterium]|nr:GNAT family N-acetyltransferase [Flavobacteriales bacterium]